MYAHTAAKYSEGRLLYSHRFPVTGLGPKRKPETLRVGPGASAGVGSTALGRRLAPNAAAPRAASAAATPLPPAALFRAAGLQRRSWAGSSRKPTGVIRPSLQLTLTQLVLFIISHSVSFLNFCGRKANYRWLYYACCFKCQCRALPSGFLCETVDGACCCHDEKLAWFPPAFQG